MSDQLRDYIYLIVEQHGSIYNTYKKLTPKQMGLIRKLVKSSISSEDLSDLDMVEIIAKNYPNGIDGFLEDFENKIKRKLSPPKDDFEQMLTRGFENIPGTKQYREKQPKLPPFRLEDFPISGGKKAKDILKLRKEPRRRKGD